MQAPGQEEATKAKASTVAQSPQGETFEAARKAAETRGAGREERAAGGATDEPAME